MICLDGALGLAAEVDGVADAVLVLDHEEEPGEEVTHHRLGAEAERDADDAGTGDERAEVDPDDLEDPDGGDEPDDDGGEPRNTAVSVCTRASVRRFHCSLVSSASGVRFAELLEVLVRRPGWPRRRIDRVMSQRAIRLTMTATTTMTAMARGLASTQSATPAHESEPVQS